MFFSSLHFSSLFFLSFFLIYKTFLLFFSSLLFSSLHFSFFLFHPTIICWFFFSLFFFVFSFITDFWNFYLISLYFIYFHSSFFFFLFIYLHYFAFFCLSKIAQRSASSLLSRGLGYQIIVEADKLHPPLYAAEKIQIHRSYLFFIMYHIFIMVYFGENNPDVKRDVFLASSHQFLNSDLSAEILLLKFCVQRWPLLR